MVAEDNFDRVGSGTFDDCKRRDQGTQNSD